MRNDWGDIFIGIAIEKILVDNNVGNIIILRRLANYKLRGLRKEDYMVLCILGASDISTTSWKANVSMCKLTINPSHMPSTPA